jgi:hypothetical protein
VISLLNSRRHSRVTNESISVELSSATNRQKVTALRAEMHESSGDTTCDRRGGPRAVVADHQTRDRGSQSGLTAQKRESIRLNLEETSRSHPGASESTVAPDVSFVPTAVWPTQTRASGAGAYECLHHTRVSLLLTHAPRRGACECFGQTPVSPLLLSGATAPTPRFARPRKCVRYRTRRAVRPTIWSTSNEGGQPCPAKNKQAK